MKTKIFEFPAVKRINASSCFETTERACNDREMKVHECSGANILGSKALQISKLNKISKPKNKYLLVGSSNARRYISETIAYRLENIMNSNQMTL